ncbi:MAG: N-acetylmuramoyl-L-alanine amidase [Gemmatimonadota bacterium]
MIHTTSRRACLGWILFCIALAPPGGGEAQLRGGQEGIRVELPGERDVDLRLGFHRGYAAVAANGLRDSLGWSLERSGSELRLELPGGDEILLRDRDPFFFLNGRLLQLSDAPYELAGGFHLPLQLLVDLLPRHAPGSFLYEPESRMLRVLEAFPPGSEGPPAGTVGNPSQQVMEGVGASRRPRVVVIDPGHGGGEPGAVGPSGVREKEVALALGLALARELEGNPEIEVFLTRDSDTLVPLWERGERATLWKDDRPGVFVSLHANATPQGRAVTRGFETYFLSEARTEHERRVAAAENASMRNGGASAVDQPEDPGLASILSDLRTFDHQHWSALLAELVQGELGRSHPGPNRGVKQGPFAVITNALMPSVLVEVGFISNREEERLLADSRFQQQAAQAMARAIDLFFQRYPPGGG